MEIYQCYQEGLFIRHLLSILDRAILDNILPAYDCIFSDFNQIVLILDN